MDEYAARLRAREIVQAVKPELVPVPVEAYAAHVGAVIRVVTDLGPDEAGMTITSRGKRVICVNGNQRIERQRFTICHEVGHIVLNLPSSHGQPAWSSARPPEEILCDQFAAELLLPTALFQPIAESVPIGFAAIEELATRFSASITATGSRFSEVSTLPCAFVLSDAGKVRHALRSKSLREARAWITPRISVPSTSISARARAGEQVNRGQIDAEMWFHDWERGGTLIEEARHFQPWDQTLTLLWFEDDELPPLRPRDRQSRQLRDDEKEFGLDELDGNLRWPRRKRRR